MTELTAKEMQSRGGKARAKNLPKEVQIELSRKGGNTTKSRYGMEHYAQLGKKSAELRKQRKQAQIREILTP